MPAGGVVWVPAGQYIFEGNLNVPVAVTLEGTYRSVPSHPGLEALQCHPHHCPLGLTNCVALLS